MILLDEVEKAHPDVFNVLLQVLDDQAATLLGEAGFDPVYGARPLKRAIQQQVENPLAQAILRGTFGPGDRIRVTAAGGQLGFEKVRAG